MRPRRWYLPWLLMAPGLLWLALFFVLPVIQMARVSLSTRTPAGFEFTWNFQNYVYALTEFGENFRNSIVYGGLATLLCLLIGYPLAYGIATRGGRHKNLLLFLVIAPFFTSFLIRTISWKIILGDRGPFLATIRDSLGLVPANFTVLGTPLAVVLGLTYEFLPFMVLPLYVAIEKVDRRLVEAAQDLYAGPWRRQGVAVGAAAGAFLLLFFLTGVGYVSLSVEGLTNIVVALVVGALAGGLIVRAFVAESFVRVTFPLSLSGVFAGSILVFIPAMGDFVNAELLGSPKTQMVGNVIESRFLSQYDFPTASALSFILMGAILIAIFVYARALGTDELTAGRA